jgi:hypothetical protein
MTLQLVNVVVDVDIGVLDETVCKENAIARVRDALEDLQPVHFMHDPIETPDAKPNTQLCRTCGEESLRRLWGPGWITCPRCGAVGNFHADQ